VNTFGDVKLRRVGIAVAGFSVLLLGVALLPVPLPGTSLVLIPLGLTILAREFPWAGRLRDRCVATVKRTWTNARRLLAWRSPGQIVTTL
jgi:hypothetical protein